MLYDFSEQWFGVMLLAIANIFLKGKKHPQSQVTLCTEHWIKIIYF